MDRPPEFNVAIVGATGVVGREMAKVLKEREFPAEVFPFTREPGQIVPYTDGRRTDYLGGGYSHQVDFDLAFFSAGAEVSREWAPRFVDQGAFVIDNSSAWRRTLEVPLVVPEINSKTINRQTKLIAVPNCAAIQLTLAIHKLASEVGIDRLKVATQQSMSGKGRSGKRELEIEWRYQAKGRTPKVKKRPQPITMNTLRLPEEEEKIIYETRQILDRPLPKFDVTAYRVPILRGHRVDVAFTPSRSVTLAEVREILEDSQGLVVMDEPDRDYYPTQQEVAHTDQVAVGAISVDRAMDGIKFTTTADNLRRGAATNAVMIAQGLWGRGFLTK